MKRPLYPPRMPTSPSRRSACRALATTLVAACASGCSMPSDGDNGLDHKPLAQGIVWQVDNDYLNPHGQWDKLGVRDLLVQWTAVDGTAFVPDAGMPTAPHLPNWPRIAREPWARNVIVGLAGRFDETSARAGIVELARQSRQLAAAHPPVRVVGWYFPVEVDPTWTEAAQLAPLLETLPHPLWISVYDRSNIGGQALANWLDGWLPRNVGVFLQDGAGVYARGPAVAREYADALAAKLGKDRVRIIAEAFRPKLGGGFRSATALELAPQLAAYRGYRVYLFDGPHYVSPALINALLSTKS